MSELPEGTLMKQKCIEEQNPLDSKFLFDSLVTFKKLITMGLHPVVAGHGGITVSTGATKCMPQHCGAICKSGFISQTVQPNIGVLDPIIDVAIHSLGQHQTLKSEMEVTIENKSNT